MNAIEQACASELVENFLGAFTPVTGELRAARFATPERHGACEERASSGALDEARRFATASRDDGRVTGYS